MSFDFFKALKRHLIGQKTWVGKDEGRGSRQAASSALVDNGRAALLPKSAARAPDPGFAQH